MGYTWYGYFTLGIYDFFGDDLRAMQPCLYMNVERYNAFAKILDEKL